MERFTRTERLMAALYCIWFFIHLGFFFYAEETADSTTFWPFINKGQSLYSTYDIFEFLVYTGVPLVIYSVYRILFAWQGDEEKYHAYQKHSGQNFFAAFLDEKIKVEELTQKINELNHLPVNYDYLNELKKDKEKISVRGIHTWLDRLEVKKKYREYQGK